MHRAATNVPVKRNDKGDPGPSRAQEESSIMPLLRLPISLIAGLPVKRSEEELVEEGRAQMMTEFSLAALLFCTIGRSKW